MSLYAWTLMIHRSVGCRTLSPAPRNKGSCATSSRNFVRCTVRFRQADGGKASDNQIQKEEVVCVRPPAGHSLEGQARLGEMLPVPVQEIQAGNRSQGIEAQRLAVCSIRTKVR